MRIQLYWPKCSLRNEHVDFAQKDSFWVECTPEEAETKVFPYLTLKQTERSKKTWEQSKKDNKPVSGVETHVYCFLISEDIEIIESFPWFYPYSGQWNAYCPFRKVREVDINELKDIAKIYSEKQY